MWEIKKSKIDSSVNFYTEYKNSLIEARFVQRDPEQVIVYLSSHNGCKQACRFCHLTATGQVLENDVSVNLYVDQLQTVINYWVDNLRTGNEKRLNINFMARGEPLNNSSIVNDWTNLSNALLHVVEQYELVTKFNISTIYPTVFESTLVDTFITNKPHIYYSLYSLDTNFRKRWLPKARQTKNVLSDLVNYATAGGQVVIHQAFIKDQNDSEENLAQINAYIQAIPYAKVNIVRYNPFSLKHGTESEKLEQIQDLFSEISLTQLVPRVGMDCNASCGMFTSDSI